MRCLTWDGKRIGDGEDGVESEVDESDITSGKEHDASYKAKEEANNKGGAHTHGVNHGAKDERDKTDHEPVDSVDPSRLAVRQTKLLCKDCLIC